MLSIREQLEATEIALLSQHATFSKYSKGRDVYEEECPIRTCFQRDRDRIIHCDAFQREKDKTQVITTAFSEHSDTYRTRLTHSLEVAQIGRVIAQSLKLNADLVEAAGLGHDLGHTPFGHSGESVLNKRYEFGFTHTMHSLRVVEKLEKNGRGLNLTKEVREAIRNHSGLSNNLTNVNPETKILPFADKIAYLTSDFEDAKLFGVVETKDIPSDIKKVLGTGKTDTINTLIKGIVSASFGTTDVKMDEEIFEYMCKFRNWMFENVYSSKLINESRKEIDNIINYLCDYYEKNPDKMDFVSEPDNINRSVCDFVASLTDHAAINLYNNRNKIY